MRPAWRLLAVATSSILVMAACHKVQSVVPVKHNAMADSADQTMYGSVVTIADHGVMKGQVRTDTGYMFDDGTRLEGRIVQVTFYTATGEQNAVLTSREGTYNERSGNMEARDDVVVVSTDKRRLVTPRLDYNQNQNLISSDSVFTLTDSTGRYMHGIGFTSDPDMNNMKCLRQCSGTAGVVNLSQTTPTPASASSNAAPAGAPGTPPTGAPPSVPPPHTAIPLPPAKSDSASHKATAPGKAGQSP